MAFALAALRAYGLETNGNTRRSIQRVVLDITGTTSDVALDIGDDTPGTFWTAARATEAGAQAHDFLKDVAARGTLVRYSVNSLFDRVQGSSASGSTYTVAIQNERPNITMAANNGESSYRVTLDYELNEDLPAFAAAFGG